MSAALESPRTFGVSAQDRAPLIRFMIDALRAEGCRILHEPSPDRAPFRITFETPTGERMGIVAYAFLATFTLTKNRPIDEHSFQVKYGKKDGELQELWQDPYGLYTTLFLGINPELGLFVAADPVLHSPTKFFIRVEFKQEHVDAIQRLAWTAWERKTRRLVGEPVEVLVGGKAQSFLRYVRFERDALGEDQGHRQLLAERLVQPFRAITPGLAPVAIPSSARLHDLAHEFEMKEHEVLDLIAGARRLKMAVRGWVAEKHLVRSLQEIPGVTECAHLDEEGGPDVRLRFKKSRLITIECKNVLRQTNAAGQARVDFQRTRASKNDPCSRYYSFDDFDIVAACLHAVTEKWEFRYAQTAALDAVPGKCPGKVSNIVRVDDRWTRPVDEVLREVLNA